MSKEYFEVKILDETAPLESVILGTARDLGTPFLKYVDPKEWESDFAPPEDFVTDPKSRYHIMNGTHPMESDLREENNHFIRTLIKYNVQVFQPITIPEANQIFTRDIGFVIGNVFIKSNMATRARQMEFFAIRDIVSKIANEVWFPPQSVKIEGGDVFPYHDKVFVGQAAKGSEGLRCDRTNKEAISYLQTKFPEKEIIPIYLNKSDKDAMKNCLHLDCAFQPIGNNDHCIVFKEGFRDPEQADMLIELFGGEANAIHIDAKQMFHMNSNIFSINPNVIVTGNNVEEFGKINEQLEDKGFTLEKIPYSESAKMEGLLRCSTLPLRRTY